MASGILLATGRTWKSQRKFCLVTLKTLGLGRRTMEYQIQEEAYHLVEAFANTKGTVQLKPCVLGGTFQAISLLSSTLR